MYEHKYQKYITYGQSRFAEHNEIISGLSPVIPGDSPAAGIPLYYHNNVLYVDSSDSHSIVVGPTGSKKSRTSAFSTVNTIIAGGESCVVNDPKGELYSRTAALAERMGAKIHVLNFRDPNVSDGWNPFLQACRLYKRGKLTEATQCVNDFAESVCSASQTHTSDRYWIDCAKSFLNSLILLLVASVPPEYCNISNLIPMCYESSYESLESLLPDMDQTSAAAFGLHTVLDLSAERTKSCIYSMLLSVMTPYTQNQGLQRMLCDSSFNVSSLGDSQHIVYIIYPDEKNSMGALVNAFFTQCYEALILSASDRADKRLPVRVNFVMEEFGNLPPITAFDNRISEARSRNLRYYLFLQSYEQIRQKYGEVAETIISNCSNWVCFSSKESNFLNKLSAICGKEIDYNGVEHDLISPFAMQHLVKEKEYAEVLVIRQGMYPYVAQLPDIDYIDTFGDIELKPLPTTAPGTTAMIISFTEWFDGVISGKFSFPFPNADRVASDDEDLSDLKASIEAKFDELFGS